MPPLMHASPPFQLSLLVNLLPASVVTGSVRPAIFCCAHGSFLKVWLCFFLLRLFFSLTASCSFFVSSQLEDGTSIILWTFLGSSPVAAEPSGLSRHMNMSLVAQLIFFLPSGSLPY